MADRVTIDCGLDKYVFVLWEILRFNFNKSFFTSQTNTSFVASLRRKADLLCHEAPCYDIFAELLRGCRRHQGGHSHHHRHAHHQHHQDHNHHHQFHHEHHAHHQHQQHHAHEGGLPRLCWLQDRCLQLLRVGGNFFNFIALFLFLWHNLVWASFMLNCT